MKKDIHPDYRAVVFQDVQSNFKFLTRSTIKTEETVKWEDGKEYPLVKVEVSSASHPFYTGKKIFVDTAGRVDKFNKRYQSLKAAKDVADKKIIEEKQENTSKESVTNENPEIKADAPKAEIKLAETSHQDKESDVDLTSEASNTEEIKGELAPAAEEVKEEAPAAEEVKEEAPAAEEVKEKPLASDLTSEETQKEDS